MRNIHMRGSYVKSRKVARKLYLGIVCARHEGQKWLIEVPVVAACDRDKQCIATSCHVR